MGELITNIHTYVVPSGDPYTFETNWEYDSWNRVKNITYPDGEIVSYHYNNGGQLIAMDGTKGPNQVYSYITDIQYNKFGMRNYIAYGNGTHAVYAYHPTNLRLYNLRSFEANGTMMQDIDYQYDDVGNILQVSNIVPPNTFNNGNTGGRYSYNYSYDELYRLTGANGTFTGSNHNQNFTTLMSYSKSGNIENKTMFALTLNNGTYQTINYNNTYSYNTGNQPHAVQQAGGTSFQWDANGNMTKRDDGVTIRNMCWDEENRLVAVHDDGSIPMLSSYIYDAGGERVWKLSNNESSLRLRGNSVHRSVKFNKTLYISPLMVMNDKEYTKHYFIEGERVCTKVGGGFRYASTDPDDATQQVDFFNGQTAGDVATELWNMTIEGVECSGYPSNQVSLKPRLRPARNDASRIERQQYFFHPDHLGSSSFITDAAGEVEEHLQYLPFGEIFVQQQNSNYDTRYKFSAKELDPETNYSYFGARYYDSDLSVWLSVDPMAFKYPHESPYSYVGYRPLNTFDPWGMDKIEDPSGDTQNAGTGYKQTEDKKYLYGEGLKTKVWDPDYNPNDGTSKRGGYVNYEGSDIDFDEYGKLKGGRYDGQSFNSIETGGDNDWWGNSWSVSKTKYSNSEFQNYAQTLSEDLNKSGKALMAFGTFMGGTNIAAGARSFLKNPKNFIKSLSPWSLMMTYFIYVGFQEQQTAGEMQGILNAYHSLHGNNPEESQGMYMIEIYSHGAVPAPGGMGVSNRLYFYYDISSGMYLGYISVP